MKYIDEIVAELDGTNNRKYEYKDYGLDDPIPHPDDPDRFDLRPYKTHPVYLTDEQKKIIIQLIKEAKS